LKPCLSQRNRRREDLVLCSSVTAETLQEIRNDLGIAKGASFTECVRRWFLEKGAKGLAEFVGEGPGYDEDVQATLCWQGRTALTKIIQSIGLQREDVYIGTSSNAVPSEP